MDTLKSTKWGVERNCAQSFLVHFWGSGVSIYYFLSIFLKIILYFIQHRILYDLWSSLKSLDIPNRWDVLLYISKFFVIYCKCTICESMNYFSYQLKESFRPSLMMYKLFCLTSPSRQFICGKYVKFFRKIKIWLNSAEPELVVM